MAVSFFDISTNKCFVGQFEDDPTFSTLRTTIAQIRPVEVILERNCVPPEIDKLLKNQTSPPMITYYKQDACLSTSRTVTLVDKHLLESGKNTDSVPLLA